MKRITEILLTGAFIMTGAVAQEQFIDTEHLCIGDPAKKYDYVKVTLGKITDTDTKGVTDFDAMIDSLSACRLVMVGETHTDQAHHDVQLDVIRGLTERGKKVILALEMFNPSQDSILQEWTEGKLTEEEFMKKSGYFETWGHNYRYYADIFRYCRNNGIAIKGVNIPGRYASRVNRVGIAGLTDEERAAIPDVHLDNIEHKFFFKSAVQGMDATMPAFFNNMYEAQSLWDTAMGEGALKWAREEPEAVVVVLAGSGHVAYNLGIGRIFSDRSELPFASVITVGVNEDTEEFGMVKIRREMAKQKTGADAGTDIKPAKKGLFRRIFGIFKAKKKDMPPVPADMGKMTMPPAAGEQKPAAPAHSMNPHAPMGDSDPYKVVVRSLGDFLVGRPAMTQEKYPSLGLSISTQGDTVSVSRVLPETMAWDKGFKKGDIIKKVDGKVFTDLTDLKIYLHGLNWNDRIEFLLEREGNPVTLDFTIEAEPEDDCPPCP